MTLEELKKCSNFYKSYFPRSYICLLLSMPQTTP